MRTTAALVLVGSLLLATPALAADNRSDRSRDADAPAPAPALPTLPNIFPTVPQNPPHHAGGNGNITSNATASNNTGGNTGSNVITGDQSSTVTVTNINPPRDNSNTVIIGGQQGQVNPPAPEPTPAPQCDSRGCITRSR